MPAATRSKLCSSVSAWLGVFARTRQKFCSILVCVNWWSVYQLTKAVQAVWVLVVVFSLTIQWTVWHGCQTVNAPEQT